MLNNYWRGVQHPERFQGHLDKRGYFEGWYYKLVVPEAGVAYAIIPGISLPRNEEGHAFIQVLNGVDGGTTYHRFPLSNFHSPKDRFWVALGDNYFSDQEIRLRLPGLQADVQFHQADRIGGRPWPKRLFAPGVMGWYGFIPGMQCYHGLVSLHHHLRGTVQDKKGQYAVVGGLGYIEKDWGSSFPNAWVWLQSNHLLSDSPSSLMVSVADIPWLGRSFTGFLCTFLFEGELHTLATWTGAKVQLAIEPLERLQGLAHTQTQTGVPAGTQYGHASAGAVPATSRATILLKDQRRQLLVVGQSTQSGELKSPIAGQMSGKINESLQTQLQITFTLDGVVRYDGPAHWSGFEISENAGSIIN